MNSQNKGVVLVPGCLLCPVLQVNYNSAKLAWRDEIMQVLIQSGVSILPMPCPETEFGGYSKGLSRKPHGVRYYEKLPGFSEHCEALAAETVDQIVSLESHGITVNAVLGIEDSPTCAVERISSRYYGTEYRPGLFIGELTRQLNLAGKNITFIGIKRRKNSQKEIMDSLLKLINSEKATDRRESDDTYCHAENIKCK